MTDTNFAQTFPLGEPNDAFAQYFTGQSYLAPLTGGSVPVSNVSFEPGCRNNWHIHHGENGGGDQILLCTAGSGWYSGRRRGAGEHGAGHHDPGSCRHEALARCEGGFVVLPRRLHHPGDNVSNEWLEPVTDEVYDTLPKNGDHA